MRFIPTTFMQSGDCVKAYSNGSISGSFVSGSEIYEYHEWRLSDRNVSETFQLNVVEGFTNHARAIVIAGGGGGGWDGTLNSGRGGGGGAGQVFDIHNLVLYPTAVPYQLRVGHGGLPADADNSNPALRTYNGGDGDYTEILGGIYVTDSKIRALGGAGGYGDASQTGTYLHGGDSGNGFTGGVNDGLYAAGGAGISGDGGDGIDGASQNYTGDGGAGITINLPYTSPTWGDTTQGDIGGGGAGFTESTGESITQGTATDGGGDGTDDGERHTGGGGGGARDFFAIPPAGEGTQGGDGFLIIYYPITNCFYHSVTSGSFKYSDDVNLVCDTSNTESLYYTVDSELQVGKTVYQDILLQYPASSSYYEIDTQIYYVSESNGIITDIYPCPTVLSLHTASVELDACTSTITSTFYTSGSFVQGNTLYTDFYLTTTASDGYYREDNSQNVVQVTSGVIGTFVSCDITGSSWRYACPSGASGGCAYSYIDPLNNTITGNIGPSSQLTICAKDGTTPTISPGTATDLGTSCTVPAP